MVGWGRRRREEGGREGRRGREGGQEGEFNIEARSLTIWVDLYGFIVRSLGVVRLGSHCVVLRLDLRLRPWLGVPGTFSELLISPNEYSLKRALCPQKPRSSGRATALASLSGRKRAGSSGKRSGWPQTFGRGLAVQGSKEVVFPRVLACWRLLTCS